MGLCVVLFFFFKQKTAYEISECDWSSDVCSSDLQIVATGIRDGIRLTVRPNSQIGVAQIRRTTEYLRKHLGHDFDRILRGFSRRKLWGLRLCLANGLVQGGHRICWQRAGNPALKFSRKFRVLLTIAREQLSPFSLCLRTSLCCIPRMSNISRNLEGSMGPS